MRTYLNLDLSNKFVIINEIEIDDTFFIEKLRSLGIFPNQKVYITRLGNMTDMICINANGIDNVIRMSDASKIKVTVVDNNE